MQVNHEPECKVELSISYKPFLPNKIFTSKAPVKRYRIHHTTDCFSNRIGGFSYTTPRQSGAIPLHFRGVKPLRFGGEVKMNPCHSTPHSILCNCINPMRSHSSWASQLSKTIDLDIAVQVDPVPCNCNQKWVHGNPVSCNCNEKSASDEANPMRKVMYRVTQT